MWCETHNRNLRMTITKQNQPDILQIKIHFVVGISQIPLCQAPQTPQIIHVHSSPLDQNIPIRAPQLSPLGLITIW